MVILDWIRLGIGSLMLFTGLVLFALELYGAFRFDYVLNRMHAVAMGDTLALSSSLIGLMIISGWNIITLKILIVAVFLWLASPVSSHLIARLEVAMNEKPEEYYEQMSIKELEESMKEE